MMLTRRPTRPSRRRAGAVFVEAAFVLVIFLMLIFGIFEYCRYIFVMQVATNATRDAARYAVVNTDKPNNFDTTAYTDGSGVQYLSIRQYCTNLMGGAEQNITGFTVTVFPCDPTQLAQVPPVVTTKTTPAPIYWNTASFTERIAVRITGTYSPILPSFLQMPSNFAFSVVSICGSEG